MNSADVNISEAYQFCTFRIEKRLFGLAVTDVKEIHPVPECTPVSHASQEVKGFVNIRGQVHLIIDLRVLMGFESRKPDELSQIILFKPHVGESFGILVDRIGDVIDTDKERIEEIGEKEQNNRDSRFYHFSDLVKGICKLEKELLIILNSPDLLKRIEEKHTKKR